MNDVPPTFLWTFISGFWLLVALLMFAMWYSHGSPEHTKKKEKKTEDWTQLLKDGKEADEADRREAEGHRRAVEERVAVERAVVKVAAASAVSASAAKSVELGKQKEMCRKISAALAVCEEQLRSSILQMQTSEDENKTLRLKIGACARAHSELCPHFSHAHAHARAHARVHTHTHAHPRTCVHACAHTHHTHMRTRLQENWKKH